MPFTRFTSLDFEEIKVQIKDFLRSNSNFTDFDFEGSNFSVLIDTLAYNTYINSFNANLVANESFLDSATLRENVVSLARNIGYVPRSKTAATAKIRIGDVNLGPTNNATPKFITLRPGLVCIGNQESTTFTFSTPDAITSSKVRDVNGISFASFDDEITVGAYNNTGSRSLVNAFKFSKLNEIPVDPPKGADCPNPPNVCIREATYSRLIDLPSSNFGYHLIWQRCCRTFARMLSSRSSMLPPPPSLLCCSPSGEICDVTQHHLPSRFQA